MFREGRAQIQIPWVHSHSTFEEIGVPSIIACTIAARMQPLHRII